MYQAPALKWIACVKIHHPQAQAQAQKHLFLHLTHLPLQVVVAVQAKVAAAHLLLSLRLIHHPPALAVPVATVVQAVAAAVHLLLFLHLIHQHPAQAVRVAVVVQVVAAVVHQILFLLLSHHHQVQVQVSAHQSNVYVWHHLLLLEALYQSAAQFLRVFYFHLTQGHLQVVPCPSVVQHLKDLFLPLVADRRPLVRMGMKIMKHQVL